MPKEIEHKFLVVGDGYREAATASRRIVQAYLADGLNATLRVRLIEGSRGVVTIKGRRGGLSRDEFEYEIPAADAEALIGLRQSGLIEKVRHDVPLDGLVIEVDVFEGRHAGLVVAEIELESEDQALPPLPDWLGEEVSHDRRYANRALAGERDES